jgi:hypothetical protein
MASRSINRILDKLEKTAHLTKDGREWLIAALDPFHDTDIALAGYPDVLTAATVVQLVKQQLQITVPTTGNGTVTAGSNWDCSIALTASCVPIVLGGNTNISGGQAGSFSAGGNFSVGGLIASSGPQGQNLWPITTATLVSANQQTLGPSAYVKGQGRVIGMGFEVVNTTAEINKQGQVTAWRIPTKWSLEQVYQGYATTPPVSSQVSVALNRFPPANIALAQLLYGSRSWAAAEGAYVVSRQNTEANPALLPSYQLQGFTTADNASGTLDTIFTQAALNLPPSGPADYYLPFDISGVHFTGLSFTTTLTVNVRWFIERIPGPLETDLVVLATASAPYDPVALELYCMCLREMPPGVMLKENPLGEWFSNVLSKVADWAPTIGSALNTVMPGAGLIGGMVGSASGGLSKMVGKKKKDKIPPGQHQVQPDSRSYPVSTPSYK